MQKPAVALTAAPGKRTWAIEAAKGIEDAGFAGIYSPSFGDCLGLCLSIAHNTRHIPFGTSVIPIYQRVALDLAQSAAYLHEVSGGRFTLGIGVSHAPTHERIGVAPGKPLGDTRRYVAAMRAAGPQVGPLPPIVLATLREKMVGLASEVADGAVWANGARSHMPASLSHVAASKREKGFFVGNMLPTCIDDAAPEAAAAVVRRSLAGYLMLPNYRNYWREAGYGDEMDAVEAAAATGDRDALPGRVSDRWLRDVALFGTRAEVMEGLEGWYAAGVTTPILVPSSTGGGQAKALAELTAAFA